MADIFFAKFESSQNLQFYFDIDDAWFAYRHFVNEAVKFRKDNLKLFSTFSGKWENISKLPVTANIFVDFVNTQE